MGNDSLVPGSLGQPDDLAGRIEQFHGPDEAIAAAREGFDKARFVGGIAQCLPQSHDGNVEAFLEIDKGPVGPKPHAKRVARDQLSGTFEQGSQNLKGLLGQPNLHPALAKFAGFQVQPEGFKPHHPRNFNRIGHEVSDLFLRAFAIYSLRLEFREIIALSTRSETLRRSNESRFS